MTEAAPRPCYVLGLETQIGLALVRELGSAGIPVIGIAQDRHAIGLRSRFLAASAVLEAPRSERAVEQIRQLGERYGPGVLISVSEVNLAWLLEHRDAFGPIVPVVPDAQAFAAVLDKRRTLETAQRVGIDVPLGREPGSIEEVEAIAANFPFPAVMKWPDPGRISPQLSRLGIPFIKAEHVADGNEFRAAAMRYARLGEWPMVQQYCPGVGLGQFFFMHDGKPVRRFQHIRVAEWPPEGGFSSVCDAVPLEQFRELQDKSVALLAALGWEGVAMVEYRLDRNTGRAFLMEINGRFWGSYPLAVACKAGFGLLTYHLQGLGRAWAPADEPSANLRCRMVATELKRLHRILLQPQRIRDRHFVRRPVYECARFVLDFLRPRTCYYVWSLRDPKPFLADLKNALRR